jgi:hypothetical protein
MNVTEFKMTRVFHPNFVTSGFPVVARPWLSYGDYLNCDSYPAVIAWLYNGSCNRLAVL